MEKKLTFTRGELIAALAEWDRRAKAGDWADRDDAERHADNADLLISIVEELRK